MVQKGRETVEEREKKRNKSDKESCRHEWVTGWKPNMYLAKRYQVQNNEQTQWFYQKPKKKKHTKTTAHKKNDDSTNFLFSDHDDDDGTSVFSILFPHIDGIDL